MSIRLRPALAAALVVTVACTGIASAATKKAAPKPVCNLVQDPKGDADVAGGAGNDDTLDIVSSDIATKGKLVTAVVRVTKASTTSTNYPYGISWRLNFSVGDAQLFLSAISDRSGVVGQYGYTDTTGGHIGGDATAVVDTAANEIRITTPLSSFADQATIKPGVVLSKLNSVTGAIAQVSGVGNLRFPTVDTAAGDKTYTAGAPSCVPVR